jgi:hypothetical protein
VKRRTAKKKTAAGKDRARAKKSAGSGRARSIASTWIGGIQVVTRELNLSERRVYQLIHLGLPRMKPGLYDVFACFRWYIAFMERKLAERAQQKDGDVSGLAAAVTRHRILSIETELKQMELAEKRERLISVERVQQDLCAIVHEIRRRFGELPKKIAAEVVGETDLAVSQVKIDLALKGALEALSQFDPDDKRAPQPTQ